MGEQFRIAMDRFPLHLRVLAMEDSRYAEVYESNCGVRSKQDKDVESQQKPAHLATTQKG